MGGEHELKAGHCYRVLVEAYGTNAGTLELNFACPPHVGDLKRALRQVYVRASYGPVREQVKRLLEVASRGMPDVPRGPDRYCTVGYPDGRVMVQVATLWGNGVGKVAEAELPKSRARRKAKKREPQSP